jgi:3-hydroxyacyl-[acyl-carrier-protein] dehydratase
MDRIQIEKILPHRDPYLMIDEVDIEEEGRKGTARKKLTGKEYFFEGHFPGRPVMPGVLIVEAMLQAAMVVLGSGDMKMKGVEKVKFRQPIEPGDIISINIQLISSENGLYKVNGEVLLGDDLAASGDILLSSVL